MFLFFVSHALVASFSQRSKTGDTTPRVYSFIPVILFIYNLIIISFYLFLFIYF